MHSKPHILGCGLWCFLEIIYRADVGKCSSFALLMDQVWEGLGPFPRLGSLRGLLSKKVWLVSRLGRTAS